LTPAQPRRSQSQHKPGISWIAVKIVVITVVIIVGLGMRHAPPP
jgi:hypothetical protein